MPGSILRLSEVAMAYVDRLLEELREYSDNEYSMDPFSFPEDTIGNANQTVSPVCSTFTAGEMIHIYRLTDESKPDQYIYSTHGDGGVVLSYGGPYASLKAARKEFDLSWTVY